MLCTSLSCLRVLALRRLPKQELTGSSAAASPVQLWVFPSNQHRHCHDPGIGSYTVLQDCRYLSIALDDVCLHITYKIYKARKICCVFFSPKMAILFFYRLRTVGNSVLAHDLAKIRQFCQKGRMNIYMDVLKMIYTIEGVLLGWKETLVHSYAFIGSSYSGGSPQFWLENSTHFILLQNLGS